MHQRIQAYFKSYYNNNNTSNYTKNKNGDLDLTSNLLNTIEKIYMKNKFNEQQFVITCSMLNRYLKNEPNLLKGLFHYLKDYKESSSINNFSEGTVSTTTVTDNNNIVDITTTTTTTPYRENTQILKKKKVFKPFETHNNKNHINLQNINYADDDDLLLSEIQDSDKTKKKKKEKPNSLFKRKLNKDKAQQLKEYTPNPTLQNNSNITTRGSPTFREQNTFLPHSPTTNYNLPSLRKKQSTKQEPFNDEILAERTQYNKEEDLRKKSTWYNNDASNENAEKQTYNHDDTPENDFFQEYHNNKKAIKREEGDELIKLNPISLKERTELIPPFLTIYNNKAGEQAIVGTLIASNVENSTDATASSFTIMPPSRDPDGQFTKNAKLGSHSLMLRKKLKDQKTVIDNKNANETMSNVVNNNNQNKRNENTISEPHASKNEEQKELIEESYEDIQNKRKQLPAYKCGNEILNIVRENQVVVIVGETGSGKTTQLPQILSKEYGKKIGITQPRRVAALSVATRVAQEMNVELGTLVGYTIRFEDKTTKDTRIKYMTDGILLRETLKDSMLYEYDCIIMDEAHERTLNTDVLLGFFKNLLAKRRDIKLIITSATMNASKFVQFFPNAPNYIIPGRTFPVTNIYTRFPVSDYLESAIQQCVKIHMSTPLNEDILIFMTGQEDVEMACGMLMEKLIAVYSSKYQEDPDKLQNEICIFPFYSTLPQDSQKQVFKPLNSTNKRKVIVSTNIAETSLTIDGIKHVIDCGYSKLKVYNPRIGLDSLQITPISQANAQQRSGRAGRTGPGTCYRLYTESTFLFEMYKETIPEIQRTNLSNVLLMLKSLGVQDVLSFPFIDPPPKVTLMTSLYELWSIGTLDNMGNLTKLGTQMAKFPLNPNLCKMLINSIALDCTEELLIIVSMLSIPNIFYRPKNAEAEADKERARFYVAGSDHITLLNVYSQWRANRYSSQWCKKHYIIYRSMQRANDIIGQLRSIMDSIVKGNMRKSRRYNSNKTNTILGIHDNNTFSSWKNVRKCIVSGYSYKNIGKRVGLNKYISLQNGMPLQLHPTSSLFGLGDLPPYVVYHELLLTTKEYITVVTAADPIWLVEYNLLFFNISCTDSAQQEIAENIQKLKEKKLKRLQDDKAMFNSNAIKELDDDWDGYGTSGDKRKDVSNIMSTRKLFKRRRRGGGL
ncbi:DEAH-box RNA helicase PRP16 SCDLUD_005283 [Saccharomycodes ludwigii]|uniref:DEAH-box RNA helicase PRP16 n=1 Tax=Saccharomycodes ludwigii TaxID=36035 RepID=UPI001E830E42|nr:hypothetical protein SCDLUD_005283 [Saccharomycodes ludwigii]KAH3898936.1 hypothetical protein SCDLUD_005283 [Saccharomycodes ludwigii]